MKNTLHLLSFLSLAALALLATGCNTISVSSKQYLGVPSYPPTNPATVQILRQPPTAAHVRLGEVTVIPQGDPAVGTIEARFKVKAAKMGADAVVIVFDRTMLLGTTIMGGPWWGGAWVTPDTGRVIVGVAIHYTP